MGYLPGGPERFAPWCIEIKKTEINRPFRSVSSDCFAGGVFDYRGIGGRSLSRYVLFINADHQGQHLHGCSCATAGISHHGPSAQADQHLHSTRTSSRSTRLRLAFPPTYSNFISLQYHQRPLRNTSKVTPSSVLSTDVRSMVYIRKGRTRKSASADL
jgi:hypothetical protein